ncbi:helix-turn-helix domain-containing protein [Pseudomonas sp. ABC1]|uniref:helix-turn-helix domain-containing protein n=1 Tax=Pseudomonas sp. ABC1 TaxID=2748080 RepID=UPI0015C3025B|nr:helix-turn-helix domain-containing protein [Pseudomonas sp. ABC1]QLF92291.1 helix-turn-helix domain-containing protein [Pseudomonas sp. ABC1]
MAQEAIIFPLAVGPEEAGRMTGHTRSAIYAAIARGELKAFKSGKRRLILTCDLEGWINGLAGGGKSE